jgi:hypothetical protein
LHAWDGEEGRFRASGGTTSGTEPGAYATSADMTLVAMSP